MRIGCWGAVTMLPLVGVIACSDAIAPGDLAGRYAVTVFEYTSLGDTTQAVDLVQDGAIIEMGILASGDLTIVVNGNAANGRIAIEGDTVTLVYGLVTLGGTVRLNGGTVTMRLDTGVGFDFDDDGTEEPATLRIVMTRQA